MTREEYIRDTAQKLFLMKMEYNSSATTVAKWAAKTARTFADEVFPEQEEIIIKQPVIIGEPVFPHSSRQKNLPIQHPLLRLRKRRY